MIQCARPGALWACCSALTGAPAIAAASMGRAFASQNDQDTIDFGFKEVPREQKQGLVGQVFSSVASSYDVMNDLMSGGMHRLWKDSLVEEMQPFAGQQHLDVAGGTGDIAFRVLRAIRAAERSTGFASSSGGASSSSSSSAQPAQGPAAQPLQSGQQAAAQSGQPGQVQAGHVTVCDINADMLEVGKQRAPGMGLADGLTWVVGNAEQLPFPDDSYDSYTIAFGIRNVTNRPAALREALRVLKRGGRFMCLEFSQVTDPVLRQLYDAYSLNVIPKIGAVVANDADSYQYLVESIRRFPDQEAWAHMIREAGFKGVTYTNYTAGVVALHSGFKL